MSANPNLYTKTRYALDKPAIDTFDKAHLTALINDTVYDENYAAASIHKEYHIEPIDEYYYSTVQNDAWSKDFTANYPDYETFQRLGFGFLVIETATGTIAAGASSFSSSLDSIEIDIATNPAYRKRGLATAISARMVLECIRRGKYPSWDAANMISVRIAEKIGY